MKRIIKVVSYVLVMWVLLTLFLPKINLYYAFEVYLQDNNVYISNEKISDTGLFLEIDEGEIFFEKLSVAEVNSISVSPWLFSNSVCLKDIRMNKSFSQFLPEEIKQVHARYMLFNPSKIVISGKSDEGDFDGEIDIFDRNILIHFRVKNEKKYSQMLRKLTKEEGGYLYEYRF